MDQKQQNILFLALALVLVVASWAILWPPAEKITQGLDIQGGLWVILTAEESTTTPVTAAVMDRAEPIVRNRVDRLGVREASIQRQGNDSLLVQIPRHQERPGGARCLGKHRSAGVRGRRFDHRLGDGRGDQRG